MKKFVPKDGDWFFLDRWNGKMTCNACDALTPLEDLYEGCYCGACAEEMEQEEMRTT